MDLDRHEVTVQGKDVPLTAKEFGLLEHLLRHPGQGPDEGGAAQSGVGIRLLRNHSDRRRARPKTEAKNSFAQRSDPVREIPRLQTQGTVISTLHPPLPQ